MSNAEDFDILVAGAGPAGLMTACLLATLGLRAVCVGPRQSPGAQRDNRTTALFQGAIRLLEKVGAWEALKPDAAALSVMRIVDCCGRETYPSIIDFPASEIGDAPFGYNIVNRNLTDVLARRAEALGMPLVDDHVAAYEISDAAVRVHLAAGNSLKARLIIAADGRASPARASAGIQARQWDYGQTATVFTIEQQHPPGAVSTEFHRPNGPLTFIPLPGRRSSVNWLEKPGVANQLITLGKDEFTARLNTLTNGLLGRLELTGPRVTFPITGLSVSAMASRRVALIGEAAHVNPPIGAQGLNLGFRDIAVLAELVAKAAEAGNDPGAPALLDAYCRARAGDVMTRKIATDLLNRSLLFDWRAAREFRRLGLTLLAASITARRFMMRKGMVSGSDLPALMRP